MSELADRSRLPAAGLRPALKLATWIGFCGGFLLAYQNSSRAFILQYRLIYQLMSSYYTE